MERESENNDRLQRRINAKKRRRRRKTVSYTLIVLLLGVAFCSIILIFFKVKEVKVENSISSMYTGNQIVEASSISIGQNLFSFKKKTVSDSILKSLPYIGEVTIKRRLPNTVVLIISETTDYVSVPYRGGYLIVSMDMKILGDTYLQHEDIPAVYGVVPEKFNPGDILEAENKESIEGLSSLLKLIGIYNWTKKVTAINVRDKLDVYMVYDDRILVRFGSIAKLDYKFELLKETIETKLDDNFTGNINLATPRYVYVSEGEMRFPSSFFDIGFSE